MFYVPWFSSARLGWCQNMSRLAHSTAKLCWSHPVDFPPPSLWMNSVRSMDRPKSWPERQCSDWIWQLLCSKLAHEYQWSSRFSCDLRTIHFSSLHTVIANGLLFVPLAGSSQAIRRLDGPIDMKKKRGEHWHMTRGYAYPKYVPSYESFSMFWSWKLFPIAADAQHQGGWSLVQRSASLTYHWGQWAQPQPVGDRFHQDGETKGEHTMK